MEKSGEKMKGSKKVDEKTQNESDNGLSASPVVSGGGNGTDGRKTPKATASSPFFAAGSSDEISHNESPFKVYFTSKGLHYVREGDTQFPMIPGAVEVEFYGSPTSGEETSRGSYGVQANDLLTSFERMKAASPNFGDFVLPNLKAASFKKTKETVTGRMGMCKERARAENLTTEAMEMDNSAAPNPNPPRGQEDDADMDENSNGDNTGCEVKPDYEPLEKKMKLQ